MTGAVLTSAVLHAGWNALAHRSPDPAAAVVLIHLGLAGISLPLLPLVAPPLPAARPYLVAGLALHLVYTALLARCYRIGEFNQVYPLARGTAPLLVAVVAVTVVGERMSAAALTGVAVVCGGLALLVWRGGPRSGPAVLAAAATGVCVAGYTVVDGLGVRLAGGAAGYTIWLLAVHGAAVSGFGAVRYRRELGPVLRRSWWVAVVGGGAGWASYALVLGAQSRGALAAVAALRETSVVVAAVLGAMLFGERLGRRRVLASVLVACGVVLLTL
ncbi:MAG TPA: EamA family transporter [Pseudonocardiaceae bacterium]